MDEGPGTSKQRKAGGKFKSGRYNRRQCDGKQNDGQSFAADLRKKREARKYVKFLQREHMNMSGDDACRKPHLNVHDIISRSQKKSGLGSHMFSGALKVAENNRKLKEEEREKRLKDKEDKEAAIKAYNEKKKSRYKRLCKKTPKGQPVMRYQMEYLLEKVMKHKGMGT